MNPFSLLPRSSYSTLTVAPLCHLAVASAYHQRSDLRSTFRSFLSLCWHTNCTVRNATNRNHATKCGDEIAKL
uniref:Putative secreted protein n=1 Tax=Anopheles marajoara TaxID=58244 RepID=A0A2M4CDY7_9DIPT